MAKYVIKNQDDLDAFLPKLFTHLASLPKEWDRPRLFVDGEFDSNQTEFERLSNQIEIGVLASSKASGYTLLRFLRSIIDNYENLIVDDIVDGFLFTNGKNGKKLEDGQTMEEIVDILSGMETAYTHIFELTEPIKVKLTSGWIEKCIDEIDIWTLPRFRSELGVWDDDK